MSMTTQDRELCAMFEALLNGGLTTVADLRSLGFTEDELTRGGISISTTATAAAATPTRATATAMREAPHQQHVHKTPSLPFRTPKTAPSGGPFLSPQSDDAALTPTPLARGGSSPPFRQYRDPVAHSGSGKGSAMSVPLRFPLDNSWKASQIAPAATCADRRQSFSPCLGRSGTGGVDEETEERRYRASFFRRSQGLARKRLWGELHREQRPVDDSDGEHAAEEEEEEEEEEWEGGFGDGSHSQLRDGVATPLHCSLHNSGSDTSRTDGVEEEEESNGQRDLSASSVILPTGSASRPLSPFPFPSPATAGVRPNPAPHRWTSSGLVHGRSRSPASGRLWSLTSAATSSLTEQRRQQHLDDAARGNRLRVAAAEAQRRSELSARRETDTTTTDGTTPPPFPPPPPPPSLTDSVKHTHTHCLTGACGEAEAQKAKNTALRFCGIDVMVVREISRQLCIGASQVNDEVDRSNCSNRGETRKRREDASADYDEGARGHTGEQQSTMSSRPAAGTGRLSPLRHGVDTVDAPACDARVRNAQTGKEEEEEKKTSRDRAKCN